MEHSEVPFFYKESAFFPDAEGHEPVTVNPMMTTQLGRNNA
jgi:hypothetical protein